MDVFVIVSWTSSSDWTSSSSSVGRHRRIYIFSSYYHLFFRYFFMCRTSSHLYGLVPVSFFCYHLCRYFFLGKKGFLVEKEKCACSREQAHFEIVASPSDFSESTEFSPGRSDASNYEGHKRNLHMVLPTFSSSCFFVLASLDGRRTNGFLLKKIKTIRSCLRGHRARAL